MFITGNMVYVKGNWLGCVGSAEGLRGGSPGGSWGVVLPASLSPLFELEQLHLYLAYTLGFYMKSGGGGSF